MCVGFRVWVWLCGGRERLRRAPSTHAPAVAPTYAHCVAAAHPSSERKSTLDHEKERVGVAAAISVTFTTTRLSACSYATTTFHVPPLIQSMPPPFTQYSPAGVFTAPRVHRPSVLL